VRLPTVMTAFSAGRSKKSQAGQTTTRAVNKNNKRLEMALFTPYKPVSATLNQSFSLAGHGEIASIILACRNRATFGNHSEKKRGISAANPKAGLWPQPDFIRARAGGADSKGRPDPGSPSLIRGAPPGVGKQGASPSTFCLSGSGTSWAASSPGKPVWRGSPRCPRQT
jgi:hypothetical protein